MTRRNFTAGIIKKRLEHSGYQCEALMADKTRCLVKAERGKFHCDHDNPDGLTGAPTFENARILCLAHHAEKTARDVAAIARAKRIEAKHIGAAPDSPRGMPGATKAQKEERRKEKAGDRLSVPPARFMAGFVSPVRKDAS